MFPPFRATINAADIAITGSAEIKPVAIPFFLLGLTAINPAAKAERANEKMEKKGIIPEGIPDLTITREKTESIPHKTSNSPINANR